MTPQESHHNLQFLSGGGEMGALTRGKDWSKTSIGDPATWPQSLRTTLSIVLNSKFPMFLWWGPELTCFYNDAYRPSLGINGKHPSILGMSAEEAWPEIWAVIKPLIDQVLSGGEATWSEDQLIPIFRNGRMEDVYWTFSYSPVNDESGNVAGVLVTCTETTAQVTTRNAIQESEKRFRNTVKQAPLGITILRGPEFIVELANERYLQLVDRKESEFVGKPLFNSLPEVRNAVRPSLTGVLTSGIPYHGKEFPVTINRFGKQELAFFDFLYHPLREENGEISGIMVVVTEVTSSVTAKNALAERENQFRNLAEKLNIVIDASELGTWEWDLQTDTIQHSGKYLEIFGSADGYESDHSKHLAHLHPDDRMVRDIAVAKALKKGALNYATRIIQDDGSIHWIEAKGKVFYDEQQQPVKLVGTIRDITQEKNRQQELLENEQRFRLLADSMPQHIWTADTEGNLNYFNQSVFNYSGLTVEQIDAEGWLQIVHPDDREENTRLWAEAIATGNDFLFEHRFRRHDGEYRWQLSRAIPQRDVNGHIQMWVGTSTDIQDQKTFTTELEKQVTERTKELTHLNESLAKSEQRYHLMVEEVEEYAILYLNREGIVENWNKGAEKIKGYSAEDIIGKSFSVFYPEQERKNKLPETLLQLAAEEGKVIHEGWRLRKDGTRFWARVAITAVHDAAHNVIGFSKVTHDLTEKKAADDKLKINAEQLEQKNNELTRLNESLVKSEERYHLMVEEVEDYAILYLNREGIVENWNKGAERIKGYSADEIIGKSFSVFYPEQERKNHLPDKLLKEAAEKGKTIHEGWRVRKNGSLFWASVAITAVHDAKNNVIGFSKVTHDLTEKKAADDKLKQNAEQLEHKNRDLQKMNTELQSFAYVSSHDLQEPLRKIQTFASRILSKEMQTLSESGKDYFRRMQEAAARMQTLIQDLLAYSRTNTTDQVFENIDLADIVNEVKSDIKETNTEKDAVIEVGQMCEINVIAFQFRQLLYNLLGNAIKFSKPGTKPHIRIESEMVKGHAVNEVSLAPQKKYCHIRIEDNGIGFDPQYKNKIFEVFQRLHGKEEYSGTGIGLAIVKKIVENHHGAITATSEVNKGATFDIYIPDTPPK